MPLPVGNQEFVLFHFLLGFFASSFFSFWWAWLEVCWFYLLKNISSHFYWYFLFFKTLFYLFFLFIISYLLLTLFLFVLCSSSFLGDRFGCLFENFLVSWDRSLLIQTSLFDLLLLGLLDFRTLFFHFNLPNSMLTKSWLGFTNSQAN